MNLKKSLVAFAAGLSLLATPAVAEPSEFGYGIYRETYKGFYMYVVDTQAHICLAVVAMSQGGGPTTIDCGLLKHRAEWKNIITWDTTVKAPAVAPAPVP